MKRSEILFGIIRIPLDFLAAALALLVAYKLREANVDLLPNIQLLNPSPNLPEFHYYIRSFLLPWSAVFVAALAALKLYGLRVTIGAWREIGRVILGTLLWFALVMAWYFLVQKQLFFSRLLLIHATVFTTMFAIIIRTTITLIQRALLRKGIGVRHVASCGNQKLSENVKSTLTYDPRFSYVGHAKNTNDVSDMNGKQTLDLVLHTDPNPASEDTTKLVEYCRREHIGYAFLPPVFADVPHFLSIGFIGLTPMVRFEPTPLDGWGRVWKRAFDLALGLILAILLSPLMLLVALLIVITSGFPIFYVSKRVGQYRRGSIPVLKFRTMVKDADARKAELAAMSHRKDGPLFKMKHDPRVTFLGRFLRRWTLDELPQLFNVVLGQLSLVGPRPHLPNEVENYLPYQRRVFAVRPGMTGLSQISGRSDLSFEDEVRADMRYIEEWSLALDLWILWRTIFVVLFGKGAD